MKIIHFNIAVLLLIANVCMAAEVNVYSARKEALIKPLLKKFTEQTGIETNLITGKDDALIKRLEVEGIKSPADLLITVDTARLARAKDKNLFQKFDSEYVLQRVPEIYRDPDGHWLGLSLRSRVIVYAADRVTPSELSTYQDLINEKWQNRVCIRSSSNIYNQSLVASMIAHHGVDAAQEWANAFVKNFARDPKGGDRDQIKAVAAGQCDLAVVNTYYVGGMLESQMDSEREMAGKVRIFWPNQDSTGAHMNLSGVGLTRASKNTQEAKQLIEFLLNDDSQSWYAEINYEYPVVENVAQSELLKQWGEFKVDELSMSELGKYNKDAVILMDKAGWK